MTSGEDVAANLAQAGALVERAARKGAQLVLLPENALYIGPDRNLAFSLRSAPVQALMAMAKAQRMWMLVGSITEKITGGGRANTSLLLNAAGRVCARYRKIHRFRCTTPDGDTLGETDLIAGTRAVVAASPWGEIGLTICYDLRMPELFGMLARRGARMICVPSNFTAFTGAAHWHTLLRARAIENQTFVLAPAQAGAKYHVPSYGHALIIDPWGTILAETKTERAEILYSTLDLTHVDRVRTQLPALQDRCAALSRWR